MKQHGLASDADYGEDLDYGSFQRKAQAFTHCTRCGNAFVNEVYQGHRFKEVPSFLGRPNDPNREVICFRCAGLEPPRVTLWEPGDKEGAKMALLDSLKHPDRYIGWHVALNGGYAVKVSQPDDRPPMPTAGDISVAKHSPAEDEKAA